MSDQELLNSNFTKRKQVIELQSPTDNSNQMMDLTTTLQEMRSLMAQFKQKQSSGIIQAGTSCNNNNNSRKKVNKGNPNVTGRERTKDHNDDDILIHASGDGIEDNAKAEGSNVPAAGNHDHDPLSPYSSKVRSDDEEYSSDDDE